jgi:hypothetical protein
MEDAVAPWGPPALQVQPDSISFGVVELGGSVSASIELANVGGDDLVLDELRLAYDEPSIELEWAGGETLAAGASADLSLAWSPERAQALESKLRIGSNDPVAPIVAVWLTGATATPQIRVDPISVDFGEVPVGFTLEQTIAIMNTGYADLHVESVLYLVTDPDVLVLEEVVTPALLLPGEQLQVRIQYTPDDEGDQHGVLTVESDDPWTPVVHAEQYGTGVADSDTGT